MFLALEFRLYFKDTKIYSRTIFPSPPRGGVRGRVMIEPRGRDQRGEFLKDQQGM